MGPSPGCRAPPAHDTPALHGPAGVVEPVGQYKDGGHGTHWSSASTPVTLAYVPAGHGHSVLASVPVGQKYPVGHTGGSNVAPSQYVPAGQGSHDGAPVAFWYVPGDCTVTDTDTDPDPDPDTDTTNQGCSPQQNVTRRLHVHKATERHGR